MELTTHITIERDDEEVTVIVEGEAEWNEPEPENNVGGGWSAYVRRAHGIGRRVALTDRERKWACEALEREAMEQDNAAREAGIE